MEAPPSPESSPKSSEAGTKESMTGDKNASWNEMLNELRKYRDRYGDCLVPSRYPPNRKLGFWVMTQRRQYILLRQGRSSALTKGRIRALESIGFVWKVRRNKKEDSILGRNEPFSADSTSAALQLHPLLASGAITKTQEHNLLIARQHCVSDPKEIKAVLSQRVRQALAGDDSKPQNTLDAPLGFGHTGLALSQHSRSTLASSRQLLMQHALPVYGHRPVGVEVFASRRPFPSPEEMIPLQQDEIRRIAAPLSSVGLAQPSRVLIQAMREHSSNTGRLALQQATYFLNR